MKNLKKISLLIRLGKATKAAIAGGVGTAVVAEDPQTTMAALMVTLVSVVADIIISYIKGKENAKTVKD